MKKKNQNYTLNCCLKTERVNFWPTDTNKGKKGDFKLLANPKFKFGEVILYFDFRI